MKKLFFVIAIFLGIICISIGSSAFILSSSTNYRDSVNNVEVTIKEKVKSNTYVHSLTESILIQKDRLKKSENMSIYNAYANYEINVPFNVEITMKDNIEIKTFDIVTDFDEWKEGRLFKTDYFKITVKRYVEETGVSNEYTSDNEFTISLKKGDYLKDYIGNNVDLIYFTDSNFTNLYDFKEPVNSSITLYAIRNISTDDNSLLPNKISSLTSGEILDIYDSNKGVQDFLNPNYDVADDGGYFGGNIFLGSYSSNEDEFTTINAGATVNLTYDKCQVGNNIEGALGSQDDINANHTNGNDSTVIFSDHSCDLSVVLLNDLYIKGTLVVGAKLGNQNSTLSSQLNYIISDYAQIDLNGHNIIIEDGGILKSYGVIQDSVGTGSIIVNDGGTLYAGLTMTDARNGNQTIWGYAKGQTPFTDYRFPYLLCDIYLNYGSNLVGYFKYCLGQLGGSGSVFNMIGSLNSNAYIVWNGISSDYIHIHPYKISNITNVNILNMMANYRFKIDVYANLIFKNQSTIVSMKTGASDLPLIGDVFIEKDIPLYLSRVNFPISCYFDIYILNNSQITIPYLAVFYPGSSLYVSKESSITFNYINNYVYEEIEVQKAIFKKHLPGETKNLCGGIVTIDKSLSYYRNAFNGGSNIGIYNDSYKYFSDFVNPSSSIVIEGDINFSTNDSSLINGKYILSGKISLSQNTIAKIKTTYKNVVQTYYSLDNQFGGQWFSEALDIVESTNKMSYVNISSYQVLPLISNNKAYIIDSNNDIEGTYIDNINLVKNETNEKYYALIGSDTVLTDNNSNQDNPIDRTVFIKEISNFDQEKQLLFDGTYYYVNFAGNYTKVSGVTPGDNGVFTYTTPTINIGKYHSNVSEISLTSGSKYEAYIIKFNTSLKIWTK